MIYFRIPIHTGNVCVIGSLWISGPNENLMCVFQFRGISVIGNEQKHSLGISAMYDNNVHDDHDGNDDNKEDTEDDDDNTGDNDNTDYNNDDDSWPSTM